LGGSENAADGVANSGKGEKAEGKEEADGKEDASGVEWVNEIICCRRGRAFED
jgi:hypothetical protein